MLPTAGPKTEEHHQQQQRVAVKRTFLHIRQLLLFLLCLVANNSFQSVQGLRQQQQGGRRQQLMCFQCHMPMQCKSGFCFGDFCVKSLVADKYVSKGCENRSSLLLAVAAAAASGGQKQQLDAFHGPLHARAALTGAIENGDDKDNSGDVNDDDEDDQQRLTGLIKLPLPGLGIAPGCVKMNVFGQPNIICYCNDSDYCNAATGQHSKMPSMTTLLLLAAAFTGFAALCPTLLLLDQQPCWITSGWSHHSHRIRPGTVWRDHR